MINARTVLEAIVADARDEASRRRWWDVAVVLVILSELLGGASAAWETLQTGVYSWQTDDWARLDVAMFILALFAVLLSAGVFLLFIKPANLRKDLQFIRDTVAAGDVVVSPLASVQPRSLAPEEMPAGQTTFRSLRRLAISHKRYVFPAVLFGIIPSQYALIAARLPDALPQVAQWPIYQLPLSAIGLSGLVLVWVALIVVYLWLTVLAGRRTQLQITVDEAGVTWQRPGRTKNPASVPWHSVRAFFIAPYQTSPDSVADTVFVLDAGEAVLAWTLAANSPSGAFAESQLLCQLIAMHTGLPLRDLAPLAVSLAPANDYVTWWYRNAMPAALLAEVAQLNRRLSRRFAFPAILIPTLACILLIVLLPASGYEENYQQTYFAGLVPHIHAEAPLYYDALSHADTVWHDVKPTVDNGYIKASFVDGSYQLTSRAGRSMHAVMMSVYEDAAVEVTVRQIGTPAKNFYGASGLILRSVSDGTDMVVFMISPLDGSWLLAQYLYNPASPKDSWHKIASGTSSAINQGDGVANQLLVLVRGQTFVLYINGHFVASAFAGDAPASLLLAGEAGFYLNDGELTASFSDFAIYPVKSPPSLAYV